MTQFDPERSTYHSFLENRKKRKIIKIYVFSVHLLVAEQ